jgi:hypothetical protein
LQKVKFNRCPFLHDPNGAAKKCKNIREMSRKNKVLISRIKHQAIVSSVMPILFLGGAHRVRPRLDPRLQVVISFRNGWETDTSRFRKTGKMYL